MPELKLTIQHNIDALVEVYLPRSKQWVPGKVHAIRVKWYKDVQDKSYFPWISYTVHLDGPGNTRRFGVPPFGVDVLDYQIVVLGTRPKPAPRPQRHLHESSESKNNQHE